MSLWAWIFGEEPRPVRPAPVTLVGWRWTKGKREWPSQRPLPIYLDLRFSDGSRYVDAHRYPSGEGVTNRTYDWLSMFAKQIEWGQHDDKQVAE